MASNFYDKCLPDYGDLDNGTGKCPGYEFCIVENDGGIGLHMGPSGDDYDGGSFYKAFLNVDEAEEFVSALNKAVERAKSKSGRPHPSRVKET